MRSVSFLKLTLVAISLLAALSTALFSQQQPPKAPLSKVPIQLDLNAATRQELMTLEGVTVWIAESIISGRPYKSVDELKDRKIVTEAVFDKIKTKVGIGQSPKAPPKQAPIKAPFGTGPGEK